MTSPLDVNLRPLLRRLTRIWRRRVTSPRPGWGLRLRVGRRGRGPFRRPWGPAGRGPPRRRCGGRRAVLEFELAGFDFGEVEDVVDDGEERFAAGEDGFDVAALLGVEGGFEQEAGHGDDAVHGRADFVAHVGQKVRLGAGGGFGGDASGLEFAVGAGELVLQMAGAEGGADAGAEFGGFERFGEVIHGAEFEAAQFVGGAVPGGEDEDGQGSRGRLIPELAQDFEAVHVGQAQVQKHEIVGFGAGEVEGFLGIAGVVKGDVVLKQQCIKHFVHLRVVFDQKHV